MKYKHIFGILLTISMVTTLFIVIPVFTWTPGEEEFEKFGPRSDKLIYNIYASPAAEYDALGIGEIDYVDWIATKEWVDNPPAGTAALPYYERGLYQIDLNCNETFASVNYLEPVYDTYLGKINPTSDIYFRRALCYLVNRTKYVTEVLKGYGGGMETAVGPPPSVGGPFVEYEGYYYDGPPYYSYSPATAESILDANGWDDKEPDGIRNYPEALVPGRPNIHDYLGGGLVFVQRTDKPKWMEWSHMLAVEMENIGIPVFEDSKDRMDAIYQVIVFLQFHLYAGGWSFGRDPTLFMKDLWFSELWVDQGYVNMNYAHYNNSLFDDYALKQYYAEKLGTPGNIHDPPPSGEEGAYFYCQECQRMIKEDVPCIPLVYYTGAKGYHETVVAGKYAGDTRESIVNQLGVGLNNFWTDLNARSGVAGHEWGGTLTAGLSTDVESLNIVTAMMFYDYEVLGDIFEGLTTYDPFNPGFMGDFPWMCSSYSIGTWDATGIMDPTLPGANMSTKITYNLFDNITWHDGTPFTAYDVKFTYDFILACGPAVSWNYPLLEYVYNTTVHDPYSLTVYFSAQSIYFLHMQGEFPLMPKHIWEAVTDSAGRNYTNPEWDPICIEEIDVFSQPKFLIGTGPYAWTTNFVRGEYYTLVRYPDYYRMIPCVTSYGPTAIFTPVKYSRFFFTKVGMVGTNVTITFDASMSMVGHLAGVGPKPITAYKWDLDGDGSYDHYGKTVEMTYNRTYMKNIGKWEDREITITLRVEATDAAPIDYDELSMVIYITDWFGDPEVYLVGPSDFDDDGDVDATDLGWFGRFFVESAKWVAFCGTHGIPYP